MLRRALLVAASLALVAGVVVGTSPSAVAAPRCTAWGDTNPNQPGLQYGCTQYTDGSDGDSGGSSGGGGSATPPCEFFDVYNDFCSGARACYINDPAAIQDVERAREDTPGLPDQPEDADHLIFTGCRESPGADEVRTYYWDSEFEGPSIEDQMLAAYGSLELPTITPVFNPPVRTLVNLDTWWWADGAPGGAVVGSEALGMRAIAEPRDMVIDVSAGGRSQSVTCPLVTERSDECVLTFRRSGSYAATMTITYDVRFELNGEPFEIPAGAENLTSMTTTAQTTVPVVEVQTLVTRLS